MKVLLVEDDQLQAQVVKAVLREQKCAVTHVPHGFAALDLLHQESFDIVLTDYFMPNMNGLHLFNEMKKYNIDMPVVLMTSAQDIEIAFNAIKAGITDFITKTLDGSYIEVIKPILIRAINRFNSTKELHEKALSYALERELSYKTLDVLTQGVVVLNSRYQVQYINSCFKNMFKLASKAVVEHGFMQWLKSEVEEQKVKLFDEADFGKFDEHFLDHNHKLKLELPHCVLELSITSFTNDGVVIVFSDVTAQQSQLINVKQMILLAPVAMLCVDPYGKIILANHKAELLLGVNTDIILGMSISEFVPEQFRKHHDQLLKKYFESASSKLMRNGMDLELIAQNGKKVPVEISLSVLPGVQHSQVLATIVDISQRKEAERMMQESFEMTQMILKSTPISMIATDLDGCIVSVSPAIEKLLGYKDIDLLYTKNIMDLIVPADLQKRLDDFQYQSHKSKTAFEALVYGAHQNDERPEEWTYVRKDLSRVLVNLTISCLYNSVHQVRGYLFNAYDITEQKKANHYMEHIAHHDYLTGLPNRILMRDRLNIALAHNKRHGGMTGVIMMDLDHFKRINDSLGHMAGDQLLKTVADRLITSVRESDTVCRMGGDEFVVILPDINSDADMHKVCIKIAEAMRKPIKVDMNMLSVTPSIGFCIAPEDGETPEFLLKHADVAMYHAKESGRNSYKAFTLDLVKKSISKMELEQDLHKAFLKNQLKIFYQPQIDITLGKILGFEALLRWEHPVKGLISPDEFIPMAETTGFIVKIGEWVMKKACSDIQKLNEQFGQEFQVGINVSPRQFEHPEFVSMVWKALRDAGMHPHSLELEITEGLFVKQNGLVEERLQALHDIGVQIAIDDFGTGYSNLAYVSKYPIDTIKIDRAFMDINSKANIAIVSAITAIGEGLSLNVLAEGIEDQEQLDFIKERDCRFIQGYLFSTPLPLIDLETYVAEYGQAS
ncbi:MAG TPA: hypothetical protein DHW71_14480 [Gammaproteobacteria bacterium]|nr:hypothetical protein [Gammaproteobacteria bacterium]HBF07015.1 hypothetical protein [Gammaproteobacteria bacterium]HCK94200.1 hypothetical protein [Gammaproteobacteria bacterium]|tara:strand:- start:102 stop:2957 length:2856 start_codon:yes stop_codon:yes gene_type:complete